jgi:uncharacterized membrane protein YgaE (UPF0421/DUF939 family)
VIQVRAQRRVTRRSVLVAVVYAFKVAICTAILMYAYHRAHQSGVLWAVVSAVLVLQPGLEQSLQASLTRIAANVIGATVGLAVGQWWGESTLQLIVALVIVIGFCEVFRLDLGIRTACASTAIVMLATGGGSVLHSGVQRMTAVLIGCLVAIVVQFASEAIRKLSHGWSERLGHPFTPPHDQEG